MQEVQKVALTFGLFDFLKVFLSFLVAFSVTYIITPMLLILREYLVVVFIRKVVIKEDTWLLADKFANITVALNGRYSSHPKRHRDGDSCTFSIAGAKVSEEEYRRYSTEREKKAMHWHSIKAILDKRAMLMKRIQKHYGLDEVNAIQLHIDEVMEKHQLSPAASVPYKPSEAHATSAKG